MSKPFQEIHSIPFSNGLERGLPIFTFPPMSNLKTIDQIQKLLQ